MVKRAAFALVAALVTSAALPAFAADLYTPVYEPVKEKKSYAGWYLRGYMGMSNQRLDRLEYEYFDVAGFEQTWLDKGGFGSAPIVGGGIGYEFNHWLRGDVTAEYRGKADFDALDRFEDLGAGTFSTNDYDAKKSEWLFLTNVYADIGNFHGLKPYIGAGIGASRNTITHFTDTNSAGGGGYAGKDSEWNFAWALHAGVGYEVTEKLTVDFGYSYVDLGDASTGQAFNYDPALSRPNDGFKFKDITSHDFKLGVRYKFM